MLPKDVLWPWRSARCKFTPESFVLPPARGLPEPRVRLIALFSVSNKALRRLAPARRTGA